MDEDDDTAINGHRMNNSLESADAVAQAAHLWIRSLCLNDMQTKEERIAIAAGLVAGLCDRLALNARIQKLVAYIYALLEDNGQQALDVSQLMLDRPVPQAMRRAYDMGIAEASAIVEMLAYHDRRQQQHESSE